MAFLKVVPQSGFSAHVPESTSTVEEASTRPPTGSWIHRAIRELTQMPDFKANAGWIAERLGIDVAGALVALDESIERKWIALDVDGRWRAGKEEVREAAYALIALSERQFAEAREIVRNFERQLAMVMQKEDVGEKSRVVYFASQLYSLNAEPDETP